MAEDGDHRSTQTEYPGTRLCSYRRRKHSARWPTVGLEVALDQCDSHREVLRTPCQCVSDSAASRQQFAVPRVCLAVCAPATALPGESRSRRRSLARSLKLNHDVLVGIITRID